MTNLILNTDSYKASHFLQYPEGTTHVSSYIEARDGRYNEVLFFGLQAFIKEYLTKPITIQDIDEAQEIFEAHGEPFNRAGWMKILKDHDGYLPIMIQALKEGTIAPLGTPLVQVVNTDPALPWVTSYIETALLRAVWYPTTVASRSWRIKGIIAEYLDLTADNLNSLNFKLHDFGARGVSSNESAGIGGLAHLVNFMGTDTVAALVAGRKYYGELMAGFSIPAAEHSTITSWGRENEAAAYANMLDQFSGQGRLVAVVSDSYDIFDSVSNIWGGVLADRVRNNGGTIVIRPDSGNPRIVPVKVIELLMEKFGYTVNSRGYKMLPDYLRVIQGDGINEQSIGEILENLYNKDISTENIAFGMGGELLQTPNRDTLSFAMKASAIQINGKWQDVYKDPVTSSGKKSKRGIQAVVINGTEDFEVISLKDPYTPVPGDLLETVFVGGTLIREQTFSEIRKLASG